MVCRSSEWVAQSDFAFFSRETYRDCLLTAVVPLAGELASDSPSSSPSQTPTPSPCPGQEVRFIFLLHVVIRHCFISSPPRKCESMVTRADRFRLEMKEIMLLTKKSVKCVQGGFVYDLQHDMFPTFVGISTLVINLATSNIKHRKSEHLSSDQNSPAH